MGTESEDLRELYANRFRKAAGPRGQVWAVLCERFLQRWVPEESTVLDVAAGHSSSSTTSAPAG